MSRDVFISFATVDEKHASDLRLALKRARKTCYVAPHDIPGGGNFADEIAQAIPGTAVLALLVSPASLASQYVTREVALAVEAGCTLVPLSLMGPVSLPELPPQWKFWLSGVQVVEFRGPVSAAKVVLAALQRPSRGAAAGPLPPPPPSPPPDRPFLSRSGAGPLRGRRAVAGLAAIVVAAAAVAVFWSQRGGDANYSGPGTGYVAVRIRPAETPQSLASRLVSLGVIKSTGPFTAAASGHPDRAALRPGYVRLHQHMNAAQAYALLRSPRSRIHSSVFVPPGLRTDEVARLLAASTGYPVTPFTRALRDTAALGLPAYAAGNPQGYFFTGNFAISPQASPASLLKVVIQRYYQEAKRIRFTAITQNSDLVESRIIIVASLVQAENDPAADPQIARVLYYRLFNNTKLRLDSTVLFALGEKFGSPVTAQELGHPSQYNTYLHVGLPPGPIDSPGGDAIWAALHPAPGNWVNMELDPDTKQLTFAEGASSPAPTMAQILQGIRQLRPVTQF